MPGPFRATPAGHCYHVLNRGNGRQPVDNRIRQTDRLGRVREFNYDELNRRTQELWLDGQTVVNTIDYTFDAAGQLTAAADGFSDYAMMYDLLGRVTQIDIDNGGPLARLMQTFDAAGNRTALSAQLDIGNGWVDDFVNSYTFDALGRPISQDQAGLSGGNPVSEKRVDLAYNAAGQFTTITRYKDLDGGSINEVATTAYGYDLLGRLTDLTHTHDATFIADYNWTFDTLSRVTQMAFTSQVGNDGTSDYDYDHTNQLIDADHDYQTDEDYTFDENGNRTLSGYTTGDNNQLTSDGIWNYSHDAEGNRLWQQRISSNPADDYRIEYTWDHRNRLTRLIYKNNSGAITKQVDYTYDLFNRRIAKEIDLDGAGINAAAIERYLHDGEHIILVFDGNDALTHRYFNNPNAWDQVFADEQFLNGLTIGDTQASVGDNVWALADNLGSVRDLVDNDGDVLNHITYDAFGQIASETAPSVLYAFGYTGRDRDAESHLDYYRARYYDAFAGRFISEDPAGFTAGDSNLTRYVGNNVTTYVDPSGLYYWDPADIADDGRPRGWESGDQVDIVVWDSGTHHEATEAVVNNWIRSGRVDVAIEIEEGDEWQWIINRIIRAIQGPGDSIGNLVIIGRGTPPGGTEGQEAGDRRLEPEDFERLRGLFGPNGVIDLYGCHLGQPQYGPYRRGIANAAGVPVRGCKTYRKADSPFEDFYPVDHNANQPDASVTETMPNNPPGTSASPAPPWYPRGNNPFPY